MQWLVRDWGWWGGGGDVGSRWGKFFKEVVFKVDGWMDGWLDGFLAFCFLNQ